MENDKVFAYVCYTETGEQIVILKQENDEHEPCITIFFQPKDCSTCQMTFRFKDTDKGWDERDEQFHEFSEGKITKIIKGIENVCNDMGVEWR